MFFHGDLGGAGRRLVLGLEVLHTLCQLWNPEMMATFRESDNKFMDYEEQLMEFAWIMRSISLSGVSEGRSLNAQRSLFL